MGEPGHRLSGGAVLILVRLFGCRGDLCAAPDVSGWARGSRAVLAEYLCDRLYQHQGVVSLAAALSISIMADGVSFHRGLLLLITFSVILVTLVGQGFSLPWVIGKLGIAEHGRREADDEKKREIIARLASIDAALARLDSLEGAVASPDTVNALRRRSEDRRAYFVAACQDLAAGDVSNAAAALQLQFVNAERASIASLYDRGEISDEARRRIERELDLEDARIRHAAESGAARAL
jgi:CPA1 family monovalent cation:H+ antiporter